MLLAVEISLLSTAFDLLAVPLSEILSVAATFTRANSRSNSCICSPKRANTYTLAALTRKKLVGPLSYAHCPLIRLCIDAESLPLVKKQVHDVWDDHRNKGELNRERLRLQRISFEKVHEGGESQDEHSSDCTVSNGHDFFMPFIAIECSSFLNRLYTELLCALKPFHQGSIVNTSEPILRGAIFSGFHDDFPLDSLNASRDIREIFSNFSSDEEQVSEEQKKDLLGWKKQASNSKEGSDYIFTPRIYLGCCESMEDLQMLQIRPTDVPLRNCLLRVSHMGGFLSCHEIL